MICPTAVAGQLQAQFVKLIIGPVAELGVDQPERRGSLIGSQLLGLALCRYVLRLQPIASAAADDVIKDIAPTVQLHLEKARRTLDR